MIVLATISDMSRVAIVLNLETGAVSSVPARPEFFDLRVANRPQCRPFGITWTEGELFVANNRQLVVLDKRLDYVRTETTTLQVNVHQLAYHSKRVWAASPWTNSLIGVPTEQDAGPLEFDLFDQTVKSYVERDAREVEDVNHVNSLLWAEDRLFVVAHNFGPSFILCYDSATYRLDSMQYDVGLSVHGLAYRDGELYWISTKTGEIRSNKGFRIELTRPGFSRGLAFTGEYLIVAISEHRSSRTDRAYGDSWIQVIDRRDKEVVAEHLLPSTGSINDLRVLDEYDYAHCISPFWSAPP